MSNSNSLHGTCLNQLTKILGKTPERPRCIVSSNQTARPGYGKVDASEYLDTDEVLEAKLQLVAHALRKSTNAVVYTGAGISTASGVDDYASQSDDSVARVKLHKDMASPFLAEPSAGHKALSQMLQSNILKRWINQNHDGLAQKAGVPQSKMNEIHGSWYDPANPVVKMSGQLREDLVADLHQWEKKVDVCLALGTSLSGMTADKIAQCAANVGGLVIVNLQKTSLDNIAAIRIFAKLDKVLVRLAEIVGADSEVVPSLPLFEENQANFHHETKVNDQQKQQLQLQQQQQQQHHHHHHLQHHIDLRPDATVYINGGLYHGAKGEVQGCNREGHFNLRVWVVVNQKTGFKAPTPLKLGVWWVTEFNKGNHIPIQNTPPPPLTNATS